MPEPINNTLQWSSMQELNNAAETLNLDKYTSTSKALQNAISKLYDEAKKNQNSNPEQAYIYYSRCVCAFLKFRSCSSDFEKDIKYYQSMFGPTVADATRQMETLSKQLEKMYEEHRKLKSAESRELKQIEATIKRNISSQVKPEQNGFSFVPINGTTAAVNLQEEKLSITCRELLETVPKSTRTTFLVIDVRPRDAFLSSCLKIPAADVINVPENLIEPTSIPSKLETKLEEPFQQYFRKRGDYEQVVILDWFSTRDSLKSDKNSPICLMMSKLKKYDPKTKYKNKPVILEGGYEEWLARYPNYTTNANVSPPKRENQIHRISSQIQRFTSIGDINYPTSAILEPELRQIPSSKPNVPQQETITKPPENVTKPSIDRSTKPVRQEKKTDTNAKENGFASDKTEKNDSAESNENVNEAGRAMSEESVGKEKSESFEEDEEELKKQCIRNGRRSALIASQPVPIDNITSDSDDDMDETFRNEEQENRMNALKNASSSIQNEKSSGMKRYSSTPNISKIENEYSKPPIDRSTKPSNDDQINIYTKSGMYIDEEDRGLTGLMNVGNTCYMNSILQCLSNTEQFRKVMHSLPRDYSNPDSKTEGLIAREVSSIIKQLWMKDSGPISCRALKSIVGRFRDTFRGSEQQDSHEFLTILIDWLHEDLNEPAIERCLKGADEKSGEKAWGEFTSKNNSKIRQLFYGQQKSTVSCSICEKESVTFEPFSNLSLPLPSAEKCTLAECLKLYTSNEHITGWQCPGCKNPRAATKKLDITKLPPLLVIHFKRFTSDGWCRKRLTNVDFPNLLDMTPYIIGQEHRNFRYELYAVSNHMGTMETGHYTAYCRNSFNGRWYKFDDDSVTCINNVTKSSSAYIVFYKCYNY